MALMQPALILTAASTILAFAPPAYSNTFYPNRGWFWYDGCYHAVSHFWWDYPGGWSVPDPKYEHDLSISVRAVPENPGRRDAVRTWAPPSSGPLHYLPGLSGSYPDLHLLRNSDRDDLCV